MEERPDYEIADNVLDKALQEQMQVIHDKYDINKHDDEFTCQDYQEAMKIHSIERARAELTKAVRNGELTTRRIGKFRYYRIIDE